MTAERVIHAALDRGWLDPERVVDGDVVVVERALRHRSFTLESSGGHGLFVKQLTDASAEAIRGFNREVRLCLEIAGGGFPELADGVPAYVGFDEPRVLLALERVAGVSIRERPLPGEDDHARTIGALLGRLHHTVAADRADRVLDGFVERTVPWAFDLPRQLGRDAPTLRPAAAELAGLVARVDGLTAALDALAATWQPSAVIHADAKWDNVLADDSEPALAWLVDWETVDIGDPAWDVATFLQSAVVQVCIDDDLPSAPTRDQLAPHRAAQTAFLHAWSDGAPAEATSADALRRIAGFAGARLVLSAYSEALVQARLSNAPRGMLAAAVALLRDPGTAGAELLGLSGR